MSDYNDNNPYRYDPYSHGYEPRRRSGSAARVISLLLAVVLLSGVTTFGIQSALNAKAQQELDARFEQLAQQLQQNPASPSVAVSNTPAPSIQDENASIPTARPVVAGAPMTISDIAEAVRPSIVGVRVSGQTRRRFGQSPGNTTLSEGSGVIMSSDGYIMTNYHVIEYSQMDGADITVILSDAREFGAILVGGDQTSDLAVIKVDASGLPAAKMGTSSNLRVGDTAVAIGNPMGLEFAGSVTSGIISAVDRTIEVTDGVSLAVIQTDAAINPGNSGGALLNDRGEVIGINTIKISSTGVEGLGFAIPIDSALPVLNDLRDHGKVTGRPSLGVLNPIAVDEMSARIYGYPLGVFIEEIADGGAAQKAGLLAGDIITELDGIQIRTISDINTVKEQHSVGDTISVKVMRYNEAIRNYEERTASLTFQEA